MAPPEAAQEGAQGGGRLDRAAQGAGRPPVRNTSRRQCSRPQPALRPPASSSCRPCSGRPGPSPRSRWLSTSSRRPRCWARVTGRSSPALATGGHRRRFECGRGAQVAASIGCSLFLAGFPVPKPLSQMRRSTFLPLQDADPTPSFGGFGLKESIGGSSHESSRCLPKQVTRDLGRVASPCRTLPSGGSFLLKLQQATG